MEVSEKTTEYKVNSASSDSDAPKRPLKYRLLAAILGIADEEAERKEKESGKVEERGNWDSKAEFILSALGYAVGLGNVWRFPWMAWRNGGGVFLIPYFIMLIFAGLPVFFMEVSLGQFAGVGPNKLFEFAPLFKGLGIGMIAISFFSSLYYNVIIMWSLYYMFSSFTKTLPWIGCENVWNTNSCHDNRESLACEKNGSVNTGSLYMYKKCYNESLIDQGEKFLNWGDRTINETYYQLYKDDSKPAAQEFLNQKMYAVNYRDANGDITDQPRPMEDVGTPKWDITLTLLLSWAIVYLCVLKGIKTSGKVVYFTAIFPYVVLLILMIFGATLPGAGNGIKFYLYPDGGIDKLWTSSIWVDAAGQIFFSLSVGMGGLMTYASYNKYNNNILRDTMIVSIGNCLTSIFAGFPIFCVLGFLAGELGKEVDDVVDSGSGLAFVVYPEVVTRMPVPQIWSFLFFFMLITLGLDSQFAGIEVLMTAIIDSTGPRLRKWKPLISAILCCFMFLITLTMTCDAGIYWEELVSYYSGWSLVLVGFAEVCVYAWVYGAKQLLEDIQDMLQFKFTKAGWWYWWIVWTIVTPLLLLVIMIFNFIDTKPLDYRGYVLPSWAQNIGWLIAVVPLILIPVYAVMVVVYDLMEFPDTNETGLQRLKRLITPSERWMNQKMRYGLVDTDSEGVADSTGTINGGKQNTAYIKSAADVRQYETGM